MQPVTELAALPNPPERPFQAPYVWIGMSCLWYPSADKSCHPCPARVLAFTSAAVELHVEYPQRQNMTKMSAVRHVDDPFNAEHPQVTFRVGGWDYDEGSASLAELVRHRPPAPKLPLPDMTAPSDTPLPSGSDMAVMRMHAGGRTPTQIADVMGEGWNYRKVNGVIRRMTNGQQGQAEQGDHDE